MRASSEAFWIADARGTDTLFRAEPVGAVSGLPHDGDGRINVKKPGSDERDIWVRLYRVV
jgi:hypothetical protein